jgi:hypothetical protein
MSHRIRLQAALTVVFVSVVPSAVRAELHSYYIGVDNQAVIPSGIYAGLPNPNYNRLTFLYAHTFPSNPASNHYHSKARLIYTGPNLGSSTLVITSPSDYVPEGTNPPIQLLPGAGLYAGKLVTQPYDSWSDLTIANTQSLGSFPPGSGEHFLFNSSGGRWADPFSDADVHLELVSLTPGLNWGSPTSLNVLVNPGDDVHVGEGNEMFEFTPVLWVDASAPVGIYEATFRIVDESGIYGTAGNVRIITFVPEPSVASLAGVLVAMLRRRRR